MSAADRSRFATLVRTLARSLSRMERDQICCGEITLQQYETLRLLRARPLTTGELADALAIDISTASRNLTVLEGYGYLVRKRDKDDGRRITNGLARKGVRCVESLCCDERSAFDTVFDRVPSRSRAAVLEALSVLAQAIDDAPSCNATACCPPPTTPLTKERAP